MSEKELNVFYKNDKIGTLKETPDKLIAFQYSTYWLNNGFSISPFSLPLKNNVFVPESRVFNGLFGIFADSLPDSWGQVLLNRFLTHKGINIDELNSLDRLAYVGSSGMGALEYRPEKTSDFTIENYDYDELAKECEKILTSQDSDKLDILWGLGGSSGGTRPKILVTDEDREWIIKFPAHTDSPNSGKMEYDYSICAKKCGIKMTESHLVPSKICDGYFKTERFDRVVDINGNVEKLLTVTAAGLLELDFRAPSCDYNSLLKLTNILTREDKKQVEMMFRIMCFNVFAHNRDDHTKNFSFIYDNGIWKLAPAYDLTFSTTYYGEHTTSINGKGINPYIEDMIKVGQIAGLDRKKCKSIIDDIKAIVENDLSKYIRRGE